MRTFITYAIANLVLFVSLIAWQVYGYEGGRSVSLFFFWLCVLASLVIFSPPDYKKDDS